MILAIRPYRKEEQLVHRNALGIRIILALFLWALLPGLARASGGTLGWTSCNWENSTTLQAGVVYVRASGYPSDAWRDGVLNSFNNRINDAIATWDWALSTEGYTLPTDIARMADNGYGEQILVDQHEFGSGSNIWGDTFTYSQSGTNTCATHSTANNWIGWAHIRTDVHNEWWTQEDNRRAYWEGCPGRGYSPAYTCSKNRDFESMLAHELGHAQGLVHPQTVDIHQPSLNPDSASLADCGTLLDRATMCGNVQQYRSSGQTLHAWDKDSFRLLELEH